MLVIALFMDAVSACHENDGLRRCEHVFATDGAVAVCRTFNAFVGALDGRSYACAAGLEMVR